MIGPVQSTTSIQSVQLGTALQAATVRKTIEVIKSEWEAALKLIESVSSGQIVDIQA